MKFIFECIDLEGTKQRREFEATAWGEVVNHLQEFLCGAGFGFYTDFSFSEILLQEHEYLKQMALLNEDKLSKLKGEEVDD